MPCLSCFHHRLGPPVTPHVHAYCMDDGPPLQHYRSSGVGGGITGMGCNYGIIDDPIKNREEADSAAFRDRLWEWYTSTFYTRLEKDAAILLTMTRWHEDDLAGRLLRLAATDPTADQWTVVRLPA